MKCERSELQALKVSEIRSGSTDFDLYLDNGKDIIPYARGRHQWSVAERTKLLENGQGVLFYRRSDAVKVARHLAAALAEPWPYRGKEASVQMLIADGIAEFIKTACFFHYKAEQDACFRDLAQRLSHYLLQQSKVHHLFWQLTQHDIHTFYHGARVAAYAVGTACCMTSRERARIRLWELAVGAFLHDLGHLSVDPHLLKQKGPLLKKEWRQIHQHPDETLRLLSQVALNPFVLELAIHHHERLDGSGYPHRLKATDLPLEVRLLSLVEAFAALTSPRPYQEPLHPAQALQLIATRLAGSLDLSFLTALASFTTECQVKEDRAA